MEGNIFILDKHMKFFAITLVFRRAKAQRVVTISFARLRRRKLYNAYFALWAKVRLFRCISSQKRNHHAGLRFCCCSLRSYVVASKTVKL